MLRSEYCNRFFMTRITFKQRQNKMNTQAKLNIKEALKAFSSECLYISELPRNDDYYEQLFMR